MAQEGNILLFSVRLFIYLVILTTCLRVKKLHVVAGCFCPDLVQCHVHLYLISFYRD